MIRHPASPSERVERTLAAIQRAQSALNAFITVTAREARAAADAAEAARGERDRRGPLYGVPVGVKDIIATRDIRTTAGSKILGHWLPTRDAPVVRALSEAGAILVGKTNTHEFAFGTTNDNPHYGATGNPWNPALTTGGSSGGSAAAVAAGLVPLALGTDTAGSIRIPAALCGAVGLKPSYGLVSTRGVVPLGRSLDTVGPITRTVEDAAIALDALTGGDYVPQAAQPIRRLTIGVPEHYVFDRVDPEVEAGVRAALELLAAKGFGVRTVSIPELEACTAIGVAIVRAEAAHFHQRWFPARAEEYGADVRAKLEEGLRISAQAYLEAGRARARLARALRRVLREVDLLAGPTVPLLAFDNKVAHQEPAGWGETRAAALTRLTYPFSLARLPAITVPCGLSAAGLPIGLQLAAGSRREGLLLAAALAYEAARRPFPQPSGWAF